MATLQHPLTGVKLNSIEIERVSLSEADAITAHILRQQGDKYAVVAQKLGTNTHRIGEVFRGEMYPEAAMKALDLLR